MREQITIGWTKSSLPEYSSFMGYKPGAVQHVETITVDLPDAWAEEPLRYPERVADAVFRALNAPLEAFGPLDVEIYGAVVDDCGYYGQGAHFSLSVGDTVTVGEVSLACANFGWERVYIPSEV